MKALIRNNTTKNIELISINTSVDDYFSNLDNIIVQVHSVGLCRTDLLVANGTIPINFDSLILGHEFSATVIHDPQNILPVGSWIGFNPLFKGKFMGLDFNGALCEQLTIPREAVIPVSKNSVLTSEMIAYLEPVAASAAPLKKLPSNSTVLIIGTNRIAKLTALILNTSGHNAILCDENELINISDNSYDFVVETVLTEKVISEVCRILKPEGTWLLKSRKKTPTSFISMDFISKEISILCINYHDFKASLEWMEDNSEHLTDLLGSSYSLDDWQKAFDDAYSNEKQKIFISVTQLTTS